MNRKKIKEIDSLDFIIVFWKNKIKVMMITLLFITFSIILANHQKDKSFKIIAKIDQISAFDETKYVLYNALIADFKSLLPITQNYEKGENNLNIIGKETYKFPFNNNESILFKIDKVFLLKLFIEKLKENDTILNLIKKNDVLDKKKFSNEDQYNSSINQLSNSISIKKSGGLNDWKMEIEISNLKIEKEFNDILKEIEKGVNAYIQEYLIERFNKTILSIETYRKFRVNDVDAQINTLINNYDFETEVKLARLKEQAEIALTLDKKEILSLYEEENNEKYFLINEMHYKKSYDSIKKEIELIESRKNKKLFVDNLSYYEGLKKQLIDSKSKINQINNLFETTPIKSDSFKAASILSNKINYIYKDQKPSLIYYISLSGFIGIIFSTIIFLIKEQLDSRRNSKK